MPDRVAAIVGGETLLGADVREALHERLPRVRIKLVGAGDGMVITEDEGEAAVMSQLDEDSLGRADVVVLTGLTETARKAYQILQRGGSSKPVVDLTGALEDLPQARLRAPWLETKREAAAGLNVMAHPAAIALARILRAAKATERSVVTLLAPVSELDRRGVSELQQQTIQLLGFQPVVKEVFHEQLAFNLMAGTLPELERRIERDLASLLGAHAPSIPLPSLRVIQAPVMHGFSFSIWMEGVGDLDAEGLDVWPDHAPHPVGAAGQAGISVGAVERDRNNHRAIWLWAVADQFKVAADNAVTVIESAL
ncbi:MAG: hypothetical protein U0Q16_25625 [Bryobacteraceae bacterium]